LSLLVVGHGAAVMIMMVPCGHGHEIHQVFKSLFTVLLVMIMMMCSGHGHEVHGIFQSSFMVLHDIFYKETIVHSTRKKNPVTNMMLLLIHMSSRLS